MKTLTKTQMHEMLLEELEMQREMLFSKVLQKNSSKKIRNALYEILGVMDSKRRVGFPGVNFA